MPQLVVSRIAIHLVVLDMNLGEFLIDHNDFRYVAGPEHPLHPIEVRIVRFGLVKARGRQLQINKHQQQRPINPIDIETFPRIRPQRTALGR